MPALYNYCYKEVIRRAEPACEYLILAKDEVTVAMRYDFTSLLQT